MKRLHVVVATPLGQGGKGGIDRIMDEVRDALGQGDETLAVRFVTTRGQRSAAFSTIQLPIALAQIATLRLTGRADVVHINLSSHGSTTRKLILAQLCRRLGIPYLLHVHGSRMRQYWLGAPQAQRARIAAMFEGAARVLVLGEVWRRFVAEQAPAAASRITILPNATRPTTLAHVPADTVRILFLGRVGARKGVPQLVAALSRIAGVDGWRAVIAGDGEVTETRAEVAALGLDSRVTLPGWVGPDDVARHLADADVLVLPSFDENLPMSVIEGMAAGLAIVATPVGATEEIVRDGETGLLVPPGDVDALAAALGRLVADVPLRARLGTAARAFHNEHLAITPYVARVRRIWAEAGVGG